MLQTARNEIRKVVFKNTVFVCLFFPNAMEESFSNNRMGEMLCIQTPCGTFG